MPIVPSAPAVSASRGELLAMDDTHDESTSFAGHQKPFMLLTLNAPSDGLSANHVKAPSTPVTSSNNALNPALASSTATLSANTTTRSRLRSGGNTPTSMRSDTPSRSPVSDTFPATATAGPQGSSLSPAGGDADHGASAANSAEEDAREAKVWSGLYARAKALARVLAPSLTKCGVGQHTDEHHEGRQSGTVSDDDVEA